MCLSYYIFLKPKNMPNKFELFPYFLIVNIIDHFDHTEKKKSYLWMIRFRSVKILMRNEPNSNSSHSYSIHIVWVCSVENQVHLSTHIYINTERIQFVCCRCASKWCCVDRKIIYLRIYYHIFIYWILCRIPKNINARSYTQREEE